MNFLIPGYSNGIWIFLFFFLPVYWKGWGFWGLILFLEREKERGKRRKYGGDVVREDREFYDIILGKKEGGRREEKKRREDRIKSAMGI